MKRRRIDEVDRISALPESLLHHILSFLSLEDRIRTSMLSKRWKQVWHTYPNLEFSYTIFNDVNCRRLMLKYLERTMRKRHIDMISTLKFALRVDMGFLYHPKFETYISRCLCYAVASNVKEIKLELLFYLKLYTLPPVVFSAKSLVALELQGCKLECFRSDVELSSLRKMSLSRVDVNDQVLENLIAGCPLIEHLNINACDGLKNLELSSPGKLQIFKVYNEGSELGRVYINGVNVHTADILMLPESCEINITSCKNLKCLNLFTLSITDEWLRNVLSELPRLEYLDITRCTKLRSINISSQCLKNLVIWICRLAKLKIDTPNLCIFKYKGNTISFASNVLALSETLLQLYCGDDDSGWFMKMIELIAKFSQFAQDLDLQVNPDEVCICLSISFI